VNKSADNSPDPTPLNRAELERMVEELWVRQAKGTPSEDQLVYEEPLNIDWRELEAIAVQLSPIERLAKLITSMPSWAKAVCATAGMGIAAACLLSVPAGIVRTVEAHSWSEGLAVVVVLLGLIGVSVLIIGVAVIEIASAFRGMLGGGHAGGQTPPWLALLAGGVPVVAVLILVAASVWIARPANPARDDGTGVTLRRTLEKSFVMELLGISVLDVAGGGRLPRPGDTVAQAVWDNLDDHVAFVVGDGGADTLRLSSARQRESLAIGLMRSPASRVIAHASAIVADSAATPAEFRQLLLANMEQEHCVHDSMVFVPILLHGRSYRAFLSSDSLACYALAVKSYEKAWELARRPHRDPSGY